MLERAELEMPTFAQRSVSGQQDKDPRGDVWATVTCWNLPHLIVIQNYGTHRQRKQSFGYQIERGRK